MTLNYNVYVLKHLDMAVATTVSRVSNVLAIPGGDTGQLNTNTISSHGQFIKAKHVFAFVQWALQVG